MRGSGAQWLGPSPHSLNEVSASVGLVCFSTCASQHSTYSGGRLSRSDLRNSDGLRAQSHYRPPVCGGRSGTSARLRPRIGRAKPDVIFAIANVVPVAHAATATIPIVFVGGADPVTENLGVSSLPRPGSNITGFTNNPPSIGTKRLQVLKDIAPRVAHVALMYDPVRASGPLEFLAELQTLPRSMGVDIEQTPVRNSSEIEQSFSALADKPNTGLIVYSGGATVENRDTIILEAAKHKIPAVYRDRGYVVAGGLASYGADSRESTLGAANYIDRILQGAKPNELPAQRPTKFQLVFNLKVAKVLGVDETVRRDSAANDAFVFDKTAMHVLGGYRCDKCRSQRETGGGDHSRR